jgi:hypothetical protein
MIKIAVGGSKIDLLIQGENFQNVLTQASVKRICGADICGTDVVPSAEARDVSPDCSAALVPGSGSDEQDGIHEGGL